MAVIGDTEHRAHRPRLQENTHYFQQLPRPASVSVQQVQQGGGEEAIGQPGIASGINYWRVNVFNYFVILIHMWSSVHSPPRDMYENDAPSAGKPDRQMDWSRTGMRHCR